MSDDPAFSSKLTLHFDNAESPGLAPWPAPSDVTDATDEQLRAFRRTVVEPVVGSLFTPGELEGLSVHWGKDGDPGEIWVRVTACGELCEAVAYGPDPDDEAESWSSWAADPQAVAGHLASQLEDWIAESEFAWGQQRIARYALSSE